MNTIAYLLYILFTIQSPVYSIKSPFLRNSYKSHTRLYTVKYTDDIKYTDFGPLQEESITDLYNGINEHTIQSIYFSEDLRQLYVVENNNKKMSKVVSLNPVLADRIIDNANKNDVQSIILENPNVFFTRGVSIATGMLDFAVFSITITIFINIISSFFRKSPFNKTPFNKTPFNKNPFNKNPMLQFPFDDEDTVVDTSTINVTLADWAGSPEIVEECFEIVSYIKNSTIYKEAGAEIPKGILLDGPPGTGKTLLAKAIATETNATFFSMSGSEFVELFVGMGASKVRALFEEARDNVPSIIFIDEIDAVGKKRSSNSAMNTNDEREQTLNQILSEMDGFNTNTGIIVIAATNRRDVLDEALLRPGRFDRLIYVPLPDKTSRESILRLYLQNKKVTDDINIQYLAENTGGFSGAQLKNLLNEAAIYAARNGETIITNKYIEDALEKVIIGITKKIDTRSIGARKRVAIHEIGHALIAAVFQDDFILKKVSMKTTYNGVGGYTLYSEYPDIEESGLYTKDILKKRIIVALGGKAAETLEYGSEYVSVGASEDLKQANYLAREMIEKYGMGNKLEVFSVRPSSYGEKMNSDRLLENIDKEIMDIITYCYDEAKSILLEKQHELTILTNLLLAENVIDGKIVTDIVHRKSNNYLPYE